MAYSGVEAARSEKLDFLRHLMIYICSFAITMGPVSWTYPAELVGFTVLRALPLDSNMSD